MGILLWESPPDAKTLDKSSATNRCDIHTVAHTPSGISSRPVASSSSSTIPSTSRAGSSTLPYDYVYSGSRPIRRHILDPASDSIEIEDLQNERDHESQIRERERDRTSQADRELERRRERERERDRDRDVSFRIDRTRRERGERRSAHMERFLNANYHTPQLPTTSTTSQRPRPHMIQPNSDQLLTLSEFLRDTSPGQSRRETNTNNVQTPTSETSAIQQWLGLRGSNATRSSNERREAWERALSPGGIPSALAPATAVLSPSNAAATISNPPSNHRRSQSATVEWPPSSPANVSSYGNRSDSFQTLVNQIRRIGALQDYMLSSVDESAASLEESLNLHSQALTRAINTHAQSTQTPTSAVPRDNSSLNSAIPDVNSQSYYTSLRVREARIRTMQSRIDLLASEFALLRTTRQELRRAENEALNMFQTSGAMPSSSTTAAIDIPTSHTSISREGPREQDPIRTEVDEVEEALDAEGNSNRRVLRSTFLPAILAADEEMVQLDREHGRSRVRDTLAEARREIEAEQARSMEVMQEARRMIAARTNANIDTADDYGRDVIPDTRRRRASVGSIGRSQSARRA